MAYDEQLADRVRDVLSEVPGVTERTMFGGLAFMIGGNMACGVVGDELMLRLGDEGADAVLDEPHVRPMDFTGRVIRTMVFVGSAGISTDEALERWVRSAFAFARTLPPKT